MSKLIKTNPAYAALAYRKTVLSHLVTHLKRDYVGLDTDPKSTLLCEEVFQVDAQVPVEEVGYVIEDLVDEISEIQLDLDKFEFTKREHVRKRRSRKKKSSEGSEEEVGQGESEGSGEADA